MVVTTSVLYLNIHMLVSFFIFVFLKFMNTGGVYPFPARHNNKTHPVLRSEYIENLTRHF